VSGQHTLEQARAAKTAARKAFTAFAPVSGVGIARLPGGYGLKVNLEAPPNPGVKLPKSIEGVPVQVEVTGRIRKRRAAKSTGR
jgi:hypothetical protein